MSANADQLRGAAPTSRAIRLLQNLRCPASVDPLAKRMITKLDRNLKREINVSGKPYIVTIAPEGLKLTVKGRRKGQELAWASLVSGDAAMAVALNASLQQAR